ncbi:MAG: hypothetical protein KAS12_00465 [Candidatus Aenigmarchaeota archaeon]|nr:hypothetical protein [Candidatus Aenigmarchaeota archaeon]
MNSTTDTIEKTDTNNDNSDNNDTNKNKNDTEKTKNLSRDENKIDSNEFEKINEKYKKKEGLLSHLFSKKNNEPEKTSKKSQEVIETETQKLKKQLDDFSFKLDKIDGRLEAEVGSREAINERLSTFAEEIGELRSMILDRERSFNEIQTGFEQMEINTKELHPKKIKADFEKMEKLITDNTIKVEKTELFLNSAKEELQKYRVQMNKIKSFDNISSSIDKLKEDLDQITDTKNYIDRKAAKVETIFSDLNDRLKDFNKEKIVIEKVDELTRDLLKSIDSIELIIEESALKEDIDKKLTPVTTSLNENSKNITTLLKTIREHTQKLQSFNPEDIETIQKDFVGVERILDSLERRYTTGIKEIDTKLNTITESKTELDNFKNQIEIQINNNENTKKTNTELFNLKNNINTINNYLKTINTENMNKKINNLEQSILLISNKLSELPKPPKQQPTADITPKDILIPIQNKIDYIASTIPIINKKIINQEQINETHLNKIKLLEKINNDADKKIRFLTTMIEQNYQTNDTSIIKPIENQKLNPINQVKSSQSINTNKNIIKKPIKTKKQKLTLTNEEIKIAKQLIIANNMLSEFNLAATEKQSNQIKINISSLVKNTKPSKNMQYLNDISKELDDFLTIPETTADNFKQNIKKLKESLNENANNT